MKPDYQKSHKRGKVGYMVLWLVCEREGGGFKQRRRIEGTNGLSNLDLLLLEQRKPISIMGMTRFSVTGMTDVPCTLQIPYHFLLCLSFPPLSHQTKSAIPMAFSSLQAPSFLSPLYKSSLSCPPLSLTLSFSTLAPPTLFNFRSLRIKHAQIQCSNKEAPPQVDPKSGVPIYKPKSYEVLVTDAAISLAYALDDGKTRLEIDFPYLLFPSIIVK
ncbi:hypothetical protein RHGRI_024740 [Rhododendron griersonianum]|uniref:Uncharacterized protein n=1 Tax=Rhododendron griersonianum TaxID=479676 RepID=A0AAV6JAN2_9ERIC|nr:hypothetical protein RHGRI_024740 [Rhododendron griersonianum]